MGIAVAGGNVLPLHAVDVGRAVRLLLVVGDHQRHVRELRHAEIAAVFAEQMHREVLADVDVAAVLRALGPAAGRVVQRFGGGKDAVDEILPRGGGRRIDGLRLLRQGDGVLRVQHLLHGERFAKGAGNRQADKQQAG